MKSVNIWPQKPYYLHVVGDRLSVTQYFVQRLGAQHVTKRRLCQKTRRVVRVLDVGNANCCVVNAVVNDGVDAHSNGVFRENLSTVDVLHRCK